MRREDAARGEAIVEIIRRIPRGRVAAYSAVAAAAGYPLHHRLVVQLLRRHGERLPWHRVLGAGGVIRLRGEAALEQRLRLEAEGVRFRGARVCPEHILDSQALVCLRL
ncbi:MAG: MGMT family protein [Bryobacteraceae bacterium]|nr:MGMT family protein [Bryobacteraceae bacterium]